MDRILIDLPDKKIDPRALALELLSIDESAKVSILGSESKLRILHSGGLTIDQVNAAIASHNGAEILLKQALDIKTKQIDEYADAKIYERIDYNGSSFNANLESQFRIKSKLQDAINYDASKSEGDPDFSILWIARPSPVQMSKDDFANLAYLIESRMSVIVYRASYLKAQISQLTDDKAVYAFNIEENWQ